MVSGIILLPSGRVEKKINASDRRPGDRYGVEIALDGDILVVGADYADIGGVINASGAVVNADCADCGAAYVHYRDQGGADNWGEVVKLTASDPQDNDYFGGGKSDVEGDIIVVGAFFKDGTGSELGAAYVFYRDQGGADNWGEVKKLTASDVADGDRFGRSNAISNDVIAVGAYLEDNGGTDSGAVYIFYRDQGGTDNWGQVLKLTSTDIAARDGFGVSLALENDILVVGARYEDGSGGSTDNYGAAYVFYRDQGGADNWGQVKKLTASDPGIKDVFGQSVAINNTTIVVGANLEDGTGKADRGAAYVFEKDEGGADNWGQTAKLLASTPEGGAHLGTHVDIKGDYIVVGAHKESSSRGAVYVYSRDQGGADNWGQIDKLTASDAESMDWFGYGLAIDGSTIAVGASGEDADSLDVDANYGAAYIY
jgi:hypothetical protein